MGKQLRNRSRWKSKAKVGKTAETIEVGEYARCMDEGEAAEGRVAQITDG